METVEHSVLANWEHSAVGHSIQQFAVAHQFFYMIVHPPGFVPCPLHNELFINTFVSIALASSFSVIGNFFSRSHCIPVLTPFFQHI